MTDGKIMVFLFEYHNTIRGFYREGVPWFVAADVCRALGIGNASQALEGLDDDEKGISLTDTLGAEQSVHIISESGLYTVILRCKDAVKKGTLPHRFRRWVTGEVLPAIRAQSEAKASEEQSPAPEALKVRLVAEARQTFGTRASADLWFILALPVVPSMRIPPPQGEMF